MLILLLGVKLNYVHTKNGKQDIAIADKASKSVVLPRNGSKGMSGNLNMGGNEIINLKPFVEAHLKAPVT